MTAERTTFSMFTPQESLLMLHREPQPVNHVFVFDGAIVSALPQLIEINEEDRAIQEGSPLINFADRERYCTIPLKAKPGMNIVTPMRLHCRHNGYNLMVLQEASSHSPYQSLSEIDSDDLGTIFRAIANGVAEMQDDPNILLASVGNTNGGWRSEKSVVHLHVTGRTVAGIKGMKLMGVRLLEPDLKKLFLENKIGVEAAYIAAQIIQYEPEIRVFLSNPCVFTSGALQFDIGNSLRQFIESRAVYIWPKIEQIMKHAWAKAHEQNGYDIPSDEYFCGATVAYQYKGRGAQLRTGVAVNMDLNAPLKGGGIFAMLDMVKETGAPLSNQESVRFQLHNAKLAEAMMVNIPEHYWRSRIKEIQTKLKKAA